MLKVYLWELLFDYYLNYTTYCLINVELSNATEQYKNVMVTIGLSSFYGDSWLVCNFTYINIYMLRIYIDLCVTLLEYAMYGN